MYVSNDPPDQVNSFKFVSGWVGGATHTLTGQLDHAPPEGISRIRLSARDKILDIDGLVLALDGVSTGFEDALSSSLPDAATRNVDALFHTLVSLGPIPSAA